MLRFRSPTIIVLAALAHCLFSAQTVAAHDGWGIVVDPQGQIYFSDIPTQTIWRVTRQGKLEAILSKKHSHSLVLGADGSIYGTHEHQATAVGSVWRIAPDGSFSEIFSPASNLAIDLRPFIVDRDGHVYTGNSISFAKQNDQKTLLKVTPNGEVTILAGGIRGYRDGQGGEAQFSGIDGMAWAPDGSLYLTDGVYVRRVAMNGAVTTIGNGALTSQRFGEDLMGLTVSPDGSVFVADYSQRRVFQLMPDGRTQTILETGWFWSPTGVTKVGEDFYLLEHPRMPFAAWATFALGRMRAFGRLHLTAGRRRSLLFGGNIH